MLILNDGLCSVDSDPLSTGSYWNLRPPIEKWLNDNGITYQLGLHWSKERIGSETTLSTGVAKIEFENPEDEITFKLMWL